MSRDDWYKWYPSAWRNDPKIRLLSAEARGVWRELLDLMHESRDYKVMGEYSQVAIMCAVQEEELRRAVAEIVRADVADVTESKKTFCVINRRRKAEHDRRARARTRKRRERGQPVPEPEPELPLPQPKRATKPIPPPVESTKFRRPRTDDPPSTDPVDVFIHYTGYTPPIPHQEKIKLHAKNLDMWAATVQAWVAEGYKVTNVMSIIEKYLHDVAPRATRTIPDGKGYKQIEKERAASRRKKSCVICGSTGTGLIRVIDAKGDPTSWLCRDCYDQQKKPECQK